MGFRSELLNAKKILKELGLKRGNKVADFGVGITGHFAFAASSMVGEEGKVYAVDIIPDILKMLQKQCALATVNNIQTVWGDFEGKVRTLSIKDDSVDYVFSIHNVWCTKDIAAMTKEARRILTPEGKFLMIDWKPDSQHPLAPHGKTCKSANYVKRRLVNCGFNTVEEKDIDAYHWCLILSVS